MRGRGAGRTNGDVLESRITSTVRYLLKETWCYLTLRREGFAGVNACLACQLLYCTSITLATY